MFIDTANINEIESALDLGIIKGVTTNPTILENNKINELQVLRKLKDCSLDYIYFQLKGNSKDDYLNYFKSLLHSTDYKFGVKIPIDANGLQAIKHIKENHPNIPILGTVVYTASQGILAALAGCDMIAPYYNRILSEGGNPDETISNIRTFIDDRHLSTKILAASFKSSGQVVSALLSGAHSCTIPNEILKAMITNKSVEYDIGVFNKTKY